MGMSQPEYMRRELRKELSDVEVLSALLARAQALQSQDGDKKSLRTDLVEFFWTRFIDIAIEQAVQEGHFSIKNFFRIKVGDIAEDGSLRIEAKASDTIKLLTKAHRSGAVHVDRNNWLEVNRGIRSDMKARSIKNSDLYNPMLDDDEEN